MTLKAIPTLHNGIEFRSRKEARWAVFFETAGIPYVYEPEGFDLGDAGRYLPDFWLPKQKAYWEVKGTTPTDREEEKARALADVTGAKVYIHFGEVAPNWTHWFKNPPNLLDETDSAYQVEVDGWDNNYQWCECFSCGRVGLEFDARSYRLGCDCPQAAGGHPDKGYNPYSPRLAAGYEAARTARFWNPKTETRDNKVLDWEKMLGFRP
jgi:hypothetical protein|tara:strand:+ start:4835 stop:5461 length:627 start_codon:yes stop_codon:yes gene_type:complete